MWVYTKALLTLTYFAYAQCVHDISEVTPYDLKESAQNLVNQVSLKVQQTINENLPHLQLLPDEISSLGNVVMALANKDITKNLNVIKLHIEDVKAEAAIGGINLDVLDRCIEIYSPELTVLPKLLLNEIQICINMTSTDSVDFINAAIGQILNTQTMVARLQNELKKCSLGPDEEMCYIRIIDQAAFSMIDLPAKIREETQKAEAVIDVLENALKPCETHRVDVINTVGQDIIQYIRTCAKM